jgi:protein tyrosine/serine phosphatase
MKRVLKRFIFTILGLVAAIAAYIVVEIQTGNFHEVIKGEFYRSAQPSGEDIARYAKRYGIKSIINLRGGNEGDAWYNEEIEASKKAGITHIDFRMKAARELTDEQAIELIGLMRDAPKPLLIHCRAGADRTGLASAFYVAGVAKLGEEPAERQLWLHYGHLPFYINEAYAMNRTFERMEPYLGFHDS